MVRATRASRFQKPFSRSSWWMRSSDMALSFHDAAARGRNVPRHVLPRRPRLCLSPADARSVQNGRIDLLAAVTGDEGPDRPLVGVAPDEPNLPVGEGGVEPRPAAHLVAQEVDR